MNLYYVAYNTNDYGDGIHQICFVLNPSYENFVDLETEYDFVAHLDSEPIGSSSYNPTGLVWDESYTGHVREKNDNEKLEDEKQIKISIISEWFEKALNEGCLVQGVGTQDDFRVDCRPEDIANWTSTLQLLEVIDEINTSAETDEELSTWISNLKVAGIDISNGITEVTVGLYDNTERVLTTKEFKQSCVLIGLYYKQLFEKKWNLRKQAKTATSFAELEAITW